MLRRAPLVIDVVVALVLVGCALASTIGAAEFSHPFVDATVAVWMGAVAFRTRDPLVAAVVASVGAAGYAAAGATSTPLWSFVALLLVAFGAGAGLRGVRLVGAALALLAGVYVLQVVTIGRSGGSFGDEYLSPPILVAAPLVAGLLVQRWRERAAQLRLLTEELETERRRHVELAVHEERRRIARELHDVISHSVSSMVVQAGAAASLVPEQDPVAGELRTIRATGREALTQLRRQLGLLREEGDLDDPTLPDLAALPAYVESAGGRYREHGDLEGVPEEIGRAAARVVREGVVNAQRHAAGAAVEVALARRPDELEVSITDSGGRPGGVGGTGYGLRGVQERVELYDGRWRAGPHEGGWRLCAVFPLVDTGDPA